ncbi:hypothetical protein AB2T90_11990 [Clostridium butyricum]|uniref:hypothetical protein n=1 Tax=Clostridium butyricum TaxID=1492 RepID=UPI003466707D
MDKSNVQDVIAKNKEISKDNPIIGLHLELNIGIDKTETRSTRELMEMIEDDIGGYLESERLTLLGGRCDIIRKENNYGIKIVGED